jgi:hypothetical protein
MSHWRDHGLVEMTLQRVFLDRNMWIHLARASKGRRDGLPYEDVLAVVCYATEHGLASFPLCPATYLEQHGIDNARRRTELGAVMLKISRGHTMASPGEGLANHEVDMALQKRFGVPTQPRPFQPFGIGTRHAFGVDVRKHIGVFNKAPWSNMDQETTSRLTDLLVNDFEAYALCGPALGEDDARGPRTYERYAQDFLEAEEDQAARFRSHGADAEMQQRTLLARESIRLLPYVYEACDRADLNPAKVVEQGAEFLTDFIMDLPVISSQMEMIRMQHQNPERRWKTNDHHDIAAFSVAVVYCDVIVIEKHWAALMRRAKLHEKHKTVILNDLRQLPFEMLSAV